MKRMLLTGLIASVSMGVFAGGWETSKVDLGQIQLEPLTAELFLNQYGQPNIGFVQLDTDSSFKCKEKGTYIGDTRVSIDSKELVFPKRFKAKQSCIGKDKVITYISEQDGIDYVLDELDRANGDYRLLIRIHDGHVLEKVVSLPTGGFTGLYYWSVIKGRESFSRYDTELFKPSV